MGNSCCKSDSTSNVIVNQNPQPRRPHQQHAPQVNSPYVGGTVNNVNQRFSPFFEIISKVSFFQVI